MQDIGPSAACILALAKDKFQNLNNTFTDKLKYNFRKKENSIENLTDKRNTDHASFHHFPLCDFRGCHGHTASHGGKLKKSLIIFNTNGGGTQPLSPCHLHCFQC